uniref:Uncharacterized protein n=1 Tax=Parastrongyloides trichosuri TaxID=131310 RepID=A0A0N4ZKQ2_PARTI
MFPYSPSNISINLNVFYDNQHIFKGENKIGYFIFSIIKTILCLFQRIFLLVFSILSIIEFSILKKSKSKNKIYYIHIIRNGLDKTQLIANELYKFFVWWLLDSNDLEFKKQYESKDNLTLTIVGENTKNLLACITPQTKTRSLLACITPNSEMKKYLKELSKGNAVVPTNHSGFENDLTRDLFMSS